MLRRQVCARVHWRQLSITRAIIGLFLAATLVFSASAVGNETARIAGHLVPRHSQEPCRNAFPPCNSGERNINVNGDIQKSYDVILYLLDASPDVAAIEFGIEYGSDLKVISWQSCAETQVTVTNSNGEAWPASGSGNLLVFGRISKEQDLDSGTTVPLGRMYVYAYGSATLRFTGYPRKGDKAPWDLGFCVANADLVEARPPFPDNYGEVSFGSSLGFDPCVESTPLTALSTDAYRSEVGSPNPFSKAVSWSVSSDNVRETEGLIFAVTGRLVRSLGKLNLNRGVNSISWDGKTDEGASLPQGVYFLVLRGENGYVSSRRAVLIRGRP